MSTSLSEAVRSAYQWSTGSCFRCGAEGVEVAELGPIGPAEQEIVLFACADCLATLEADRETAARRAGVPYIPGGVIPR
ncbi:hypothetical protein [Kitasatospora kifunensis]|uniref:Uncharacterized protein n=1 Tax=Kitasatospora kifunensis TaxID=58351 RepID=A0A7W7QYX8_KITKI|nr:hypothetical protein [Kitasatospora kifunensis]MBB4922299.1 hypothetical protein [Kitasatospora kifunensis]